MTLGLQHCHKNERKKYKWILIQVDTEKDFHKSGMHLTDKYMLTQLATKTQLLKMKQTTTCEDL